MKMMIANLLALSSISIFAANSNVLKSCDFGFAQINYELVDLSTIPSENLNGFQIYTSLTKQVVFDNEIPFKKTIATVTHKRNKIFIDYPVMQEDGKMESNQSIKVLTKQHVSKNEEEIVYKAILNTIGIKDEGTCRFSF